MADVAPVSDARSDAPPLRAPAPLATRASAALAWTESVTDPGRTRVPDDVYEEVRRHFSERETVDLTMAVIAINMWNRLAVSTRTETGSYQPRKAALSRAFPPAPTPGDHGTEPIPAR
jgi:hypothetical protein